ncbi:hypothetical protein F9B16_02445 [Actinomadura montaniterrae]|uniref:WXG100 family type VII secretion target n=1 Tax=Actinomadura montaniterrae TaxID=1803903 RepID=A0A6L3W5D9_9ACTN|nr:hypothetical protein F9B16_02445 [Actinomadura montaniterrae]
MNGWDQGTEALVDMARQTEDRGVELAALIKLLIFAAEPLFPKFHGAGRAPFDRFKEHADRLTADLKGHLNRVNTAQSGLEATFAGGDQEMADRATRKMSGAVFDRTKFRPR